MQRHVSKVELVTASVIALFLVVVFPGLHAAGAVSDFTIKLWGKYLCYGLLAISVDLLWGYTGLLSLGQALFFSLGGYMLGMNLMLMIGEDGQYFKSGNNPSLLPDFMVILGRTELPSFWKPFYNFPFAVAMVVLVPGLLAFLFGFLGFRSRIKGVYFSILTQALTYVAAVFFQNALIMGSNNGFTDFKRILGCDIRASATQRGLYIATALALVLVYAFCRWLTTTKFGLVQRAVRDSETRALFSGYAAANYKLFVFVVASIIGSIGGALYLPQAGILNPTEMMPEKSLEAVVWCAVGGRGTLIGPIIGAIGTNALKSWATRAFPDLWLIILGGLFILIVLFLPKGIFGLLGQARDFFAKRKPEAASATAEPAKP
ncbi:MAG: urea ABC transporter permease subunit UrtC [Chthoniobacter sp.]|nr:urea ABC transporter permease subunit UrtC [Chthoniobacter sp.]